MKLASGKSSTTIEVLTATGANPVGEAWIKLGVPQCGYCQPGQTMQAVALLAKLPKPSEAEIEEAMSCNICRRATYQRIEATVVEASRGGAE